MKNHLFLYPHTLPTITIMNLNVQNNQPLHLSLRHLRVIDLKEIIRSISRETGVRIPITGNKDLIISNIVHRISILAEKGDDNLVRCLSIINRKTCRRKGEPHWIAHNGVVYNRPLLMAEPRGRLLTHGSHSDTATSSSSPSSSVPPRLADITRSCPTVTYKSGPFYTVIHILCAPKVCEVAPFSRNSETFKFTFDEEQRRLLRLTDPEFQIRFCCAVLPVPSTNNPLLLEFPPICEIKVNSHTIQAQAVRGLKNKPGTVNSLNITDMCSIEGPNHVELVYANTGKRYVGSIQLVRRIPIEALVNLLVKNHYIPKEEVLEKYRQQQKDADIVMESETLSLKCPLSFSRIKLPCRSVMCKHAQCFDATAFLAMNEQTPTWSCPVCYRQIESFDDLIADGFYADVLEKFGTEIESFKIDSEGNIQLSDESKTHLNIKQEENTTFISVDSAFAAEGSKAVPEQGSPLSAGGDHKLTLPPLSSPASPASQPSSLQQLPQQALPPLSLVLLPGAPSPRKEVEVIDLTLDSDDD